MTSASDVSTASGDTPVLAIVVSPGGSLSGEKRHLGQLRPGNTRIRVRFGGICGSDLHYVSHGAAGTSILSAPMVLGHEISGTIAEADPASPFALGSPVTVHPATPCGTCAECAGGQAHLCGSLRYLGSAGLVPHTDGGFAELIDVPTAQVRVLPTGVDERRAALAEPLAVAVHAVNRAGNVQGASTVVNGAGPIGQLIVAVLAWRGAASIATVDIATYSLDIARRLGATSIHLPADGLPDRADIVFEATGVPQAWQQAVDLVRPGGVLVQVGLLPSGPLALPVGLIVSREIDYRGSFRFDGEIDEALALLTDGLDIDAVISHVFPVADVAEAFAIAADRSASAKVLLDFA